MPLDFNQLRELLSAIAQTDIAELTLKSADFELTVRKGLRTMPTTDSTSGGAGAMISAGFINTPAESGAIPTAPAPVPAPAPEVVIQQAPAVPIAAPPTIDPKWEEVKSPMVGTFYRASGPDEAPFVEVGERIRTGQTVCIIEAMKLMNEIEAEVSGQVMEILVTNGEPVEYGQPLMRVNPG